MLSVTTRARLWRLLRREKGEPAAAERRAELGGAGTWGGAAPPRSAAAAAGEAGRCFPSSSVASPRLQRHKAQANVTGRSRSQPAGPTPAPFYPDAAHPNSCLFRPCQARDRKKKKQPRSTRTRRSFSRPAAWGDAAAERGGGRQRQHHCWAGRLEAGPGVVVVAAAAAAAASTHEPSKARGPDRRTALWRRRDQQPPPRPRRTNSSSWSPWGQLEPPFTSAGFLATFRGVFEKNSSARCRRCLASWAGKSAWTWKKSDGSGPGRGAGLKYEKKKGERYGVLRG